MQGCKNRLPQPRPRDLYDVKFHVPFLKQTPPPDNALSQRLKASDAPWPPSSPGSPLPLPQARRAVPRCPAFCPGDD